MTSKQKKIAIGLFGLILICSAVTWLTAADEGVSFITLGDGIKVTMSQSQFDSLTRQPGISYSGPTKPVPPLLAAQMAVPVPSSIGGVLGGGYIVGEPGAIATGMNSVGMTSAATAKTVAAAKSAAGLITMGTAAAANSTCEGSIKVGYGIVQSDNPAAFQSDCGGSSTMSATAQHR